MLALGYIGIFAGALLLIAGVTGSSIASVAKGSPDHSNVQGSALSGVAGEAQVPVGPAPAAGGPWRSTQAAIAQSRGWSLADWNAVIQRESGGDPNSRNASSGAYGIGQFLPSNRGAYPEAFSPNAVLQIKAMGRYIADRYGNPTNALAHERAYGWY